jgi:hypothetical protein
MFASGRKRTNVRSSKPQRKGDNTTTLPQTLLKGKHIYTLFTY